MRELFPYSNCCSDPFSCSAVHLNCTCSLVVELHIMVRIRFAVILYFRMLVLMLEVLFTQDFEVDYLCRGASSGS